MDETAIKALIASSLEEMLTPLVAEMTSTVTQHITQATDRIKALEDHVTSPEGKPKATQEAPKEPKEGTLTARIKQLEDQLAQKAEAEAKAKYHSAIDSALDGYPTTYRAEAKKLLLAELGDSLEDTEAGYVAKDGTTLTDKVKGFFESPFGKHLLPSQHPGDGLGTKVPEATATQPKPDLETALRSAWMG